MFSTTFYAKEPRLTLEGDGVAPHTSAETEEHWHVLRIHVADERLKALIKKIDPTYITIQMVEQDQAEFGMALEDGKVIFDIFDSLVTKYGVTRMPFSLEPTLEAISPVLRAADHFYWHLRRTPEVGGDTLANLVEIELAEMEFECADLGDDLEALVKWNPTRAGWKRGKVFDLQITDTGTIYGWKITVTNNSNVALYPALFYFDNSDWSISQYSSDPSQLPTALALARDIIDPSRKALRYLPYTFFLREGQNIDVGILKLFLSKEQIDLSDIAQLSPFVPIGTRARPKIERPTKSRFLWDTILVPVVQRRADK